MTTTTVRTATQTPDQPISPTSGPGSGGPRRPRRRAATVGIVAGGILVAGAAVATGVLLGQRATSSPAPAVGTAVTFPTDWQVYRAGERGDVVPAPRPADWSSYRAGERTGAAATPTASAAVTFPSDWQVYRSGERATTTSTNPGFASDWNSYRAGEH
jgi:hypothetical protein